jgi:hypothetical protein
MLALPCLMAATPIPLSVFRSSVLVPSHQYGSAKFHQTMVKSGRFWSALCTKKSAIGSR